MTASFQAEVYRLEGLRRNLSREAKGFPMQIRFNARSFFWPLIYSQIFQRLKSANIFGV